MEPTGGKTGTGVSGKCESVKVTHEANELWRQDLKLCEQWLKVAEKQLVGNDCLVKAVQALTGALNHTGLGNVLVCGGVGVGPCGRERRGWMWRAAWRKVVRMMRMMWMVKRRVLRVKERGMIKKCKIVEGKMRMNEWRESTRKGENLW